MSPTNRESEQLMKIDGKRKKEDIEVFKQLNGNLESGIRSKNLENYFCITRRERREKIQIT